MKKRILFVYTRLGFESLCKLIPKHLNRRTILLAQRSENSRLYMFWPRGGGVSKPSSAVQGRAIILGYLFPEKVRNYGYEFLKYVRNHDYHLKKTAKIWAPFC